MINIISALKIICLKLQNKDTEVSFQAASLPTFVLIVIFQLYILWDFSEENINVAQNIYRLDTDLRNKWSMSQSRSINVTVKVKVTFRVKVTVNFLIKIKVYLSICDFICSGYNFWTFLVWRYVFNISRSSLSINFIGSRSRSY